MVVVLGSHEGRRQMTIRWMLQSSFLMVRYQSTGWISAVSVEKILMPIEAHVRSPLARGSYRFAPTIRASRLDLLRPQQMVYLPKPLVCSFDLVLVLELSCSLPCLLTFHPRGLYLYDG